MKRYTLIMPAALVISIAGLLTVLLTSCTPVVVKTQDTVKKDTYTFTDIQLPAQPKEPFPTANVDYDNHNRMVFFNFITGKMQTIDSTAWDIAIAVGDTPDTAPNGSALPSTETIYTVTNSGDYGEHARLLPFKAGKTSNDYLGTALAKIQQVSFKYGEKDLSPFQSDPDTDKPTANPFYTALKNGTHYLLKTGKTDETAAVYEIWFDPIIPAAGASFTLHVKPAILSHAGTSEATPKTITGFEAEYTLTGNINSSYSFNYIKLDSTSARILTKSDGIPEKTEWQLLFTRTNVYAKEMGDLLNTDGIVSTSSILTNSPAGVETASLYGWDFPEVQKVPDSSFFVKHINGVGKGFSNPFKDDPEKRRKAWYYGVSMPPTFYLSRITYVFKWVASSTTHYAKFRPGTFYGPQGEKFYVTFRYAAQ